MSWEIEGRTVLITGAARGIGADAAERLHARGANVALVGLEPERLEALAARLGADRAAAFEADVTVDGVDGGPVRAVFIRAPWVEEVGAGVEVLSSVALPTGGEAVVAVRQGNLLATSFHPEVTNDARVHALFVRMVEHARG